MAIITIDTDVQASENVFMAYKDAQYQTRLRVGQFLYPALVQTIGMYDALDDRLAEGGDLADMADYHADKLSPLAAGVEALLAGIASMMGLIEQMEAGMPEGETLFPGVPKPVE